MNQEADSKDNVMHIKMSDFSDLYRGTTYCIHGNDRHGLIVSDIWESLLCDPPNSNAH